MDDQDGYILTTLRSLDYNISSDIVSLKQIDSDTLKAICLKFFANEGHNISQFTTNAQTQKYRVATKVCDFLQKTFKIHCKITNFMNPSQFETRKVLLQIMQQTTNKQDENIQQLDTDLSVSQKVQQKRQEQSKLILDEWISREWVLPILNPQKVNNQRNIDTNIISTEEKSLNKLKFIDYYRGLKNHKGIYSTVSKTLNQIEKKFIIDALIKSSENQDLVEQLKNFEETKKLKITSRQQRQYKNLKLKNVIQWNKQQQNRNKQQQQQQSEQQYLDGTQNMFNMEVNFLQEEKDVKQVNEVQEEMIVEEETVEETAEAIQKRHEKELNSMMEDIQVKEQILNEKQDMITKLIEDNQIEEEETDKTKKAYKQLEEEIQKQHKLLVFLEDEQQQQNLAKQNKEMENKINEMQKQWIDHQKEVINNLKQQQKQVEFKKAKFKETEERIEEIDNDYNKLLSDIQTSQQQIELYRQIFDKMPKDVSRNLYLKRLKELFEKLNKQKEQYKEQELALKEIKDTIAYYENVLERHCKEIEQIISLDANISFKKLESNMKISKMFPIFKEILDNTIKYLQEESDIKIQFQTLQSEIYLLESKKYKNNNEQILYDLNEVLVENEKLKKQLNN